MRAFGLAPVLPSVLMDTPASAAARVDAPGNITDHLVQLQMAEKARDHFNQAQCSAKIIRAIAETKRVETHRETVIPDDLVLFWNISVDKTQRGWRGPARVVAVDPSAKTIQMAYGGHYITRHSSKVRRVEDMRYTPVIEASDQIPQVKLATINLKDVDDWSPEDGIEPEVPKVMSDKQVLEFKEADDMVIREDLPATKKLLDGLLNKFHVAPGSKRIRTPKQALLACGQLEQVWSEEGASAEWQQAWKATVYDDMKANFNMVAVQIEKTPEGCFIAKKFQKNKNEVVGDEYRRNKAAFYRADLKEVETLFEMGALQRIPLAKLEVGVELLGCGLSEPGKKCQGSLIRRNPVWWSKDTRKSWIRMGSGSMLRQAQGSH